jgi:carbamate kinase
MRLVVALGGNALLQRGEPMDAATQRHNVTNAVLQGIAPLASAHELVITHGNGPQIGLLALQAAAYPDVTPPPLDVLGAESEGMIGYLIAQALAGALPQFDIAALLTLVEIDPADPALAAPSKPIGPVYGEAEARRLAEKHAWSLARDGSGWRRVVASPEPQRILGLNPIRTLLRSGAIVICGGGGGIPVTASTPGLSGVEAVIDKDRVAALLAEELAADFLLILTDVPGVWPRWPVREGPVIERATPAALHSYRFDPGSMAPKVEAACRFVTRTGRRAAIGRIADATQILAGRAGTAIVPD